MMSADPNAAESSETLQYLTPQFHEDEHEDSEAEGVEEEDDISALTGGFEEDSYGDDDLDDVEDDDFYDLDEYASEDGYGGDSGF